MIGTISKTNRHLHRHLRVLNTTHGASFLPTSPWTSCLRPVQIARLSAPLIELFGRVDRHGEHTRPLAGLSGLSAAHCLREKNSGALSLFFQRSSPFEISIRKGLVLAQRSTSPLFLTRLRSCFYSVWYSESAVLRQMHIS